MLNHEMDAGARNWMFKHARRHYWRVAAWIDFDDLVQDGFAAYYETLQRYPTATQPSHRMSLFMLVFRSKIEDLVRDHRKQIDDARSDIVENIENTNNPMLVLPDMLTLQSLLLKAPQQIKDVLMLFTNEQKRVELAKPFVQDDSGRRETLNQRFCSLLGWDPVKVNVVGMLREHFSTT